MLRLGAGLAPGVILAAAYNVARFGSPWELGLPGRRPDDALPRRAAGLLAHPLKSVVPPHYRARTSPLDVADQWPAGDRDRGSVAITFRLTAAWFAWYDAGGAGAHACCCCPWSCSPWRWWGRG